MEVYMEDKLLAVLAEYAKKEKSDDMTEKEVVTEIVEAFNGSGIRLVLQEKIGRILCGQLMDDDYEEEEF
jgi:hypothetical protein